MKHTMAIVGFGGMGRWHAKNISERLENITVKGIFDISDTAKDFAAEKQLYSYDSFQEILEDEEVELVTIATPNDVHKYYVIECLKAGKNVVCEKPVTLCAADLEDIMAVAEQTGKVFSVHQNRRWDKDFKTALKIVEDNMIGHVYFIESRVQGSRKSMHGWRGHKINGGGMVLDWGAHLIDQALQLIKCPVVSVDAHLLSLYSDQVDDNIKLFLRFENGASVMLEMVTNCLIRSPRWHISGLEGTAVVNNWEDKGKIVQLKEDAELKWEDEIVYTEAGPTRTMAPRPSYATIESELPEVESNWEDYYNNIIGVIEGKAELIVKPEQTLRVMKVIDKIFEAREKNAGVTCNI